MNYFDGKGDLWIEVKAGQMPASLPPGITSGFATLGAHPQMPQAQVAVTTINLTAYIRSLSKPDWLNAALTSTSANITIEPKDAA